MIREPRLGGDGGAALGAAPTFDAPLSHRSGSPWNLSAVPGTSPRTVRRCSVLLVGRAIRYLLGFSVLLNQLKGPSSPSQDFVVCQHFRRLKMPSE